MQDVVVPPERIADELAAFLDDLFHEYASVEHHIGKDNWLGYCSEAFDEFVSA